MTAVHLFGGRRLWSLVVAVTVASACAVSFRVSGSASRASEAMVSFSSTSVNGVHCRKVASVNRPAAPMPMSGVRALERLARVEAGPQLAPTATGVSAMSDMRDATAVQMSLGDRSALISELRHAAEASCHVLTIAAAESAGYYLAAPYLDGVGSHWINWAYVDRPFDPARPSMLLFKTTGEVSQLAGFSYWVRSADAPSGFSGPADHWHRHSGLCFVGGQWAGEGMTRSECDGAWLNGRDLWMLHAWVVPDSENPAGMFAPLSRSLCRPRTPQIDACPGRGRPGT